MLCTHNTTTSASLDYCHKLTNPYLHQFSSISSGNCISWEYHLDNPNTSVNPNFFRSTLILPPVYSWELSHHMHDSVETYDSLICHTTHKTCLSVCQSHQPSICHTTNMMCPSICQSCQLSDHCTVDTNSLSVCQPHESPVCHTTMATSLSVCQTYIPPVRNTMMMTSPSI